MGLEALLLWHPKVFPSFVLISLISHSNTHWPHTIQKSSSGLGSGCWFFWRHKPTVPKQCGVNIGQNALEQGSRVSMLRWQPPWSCWEAHVESCLTQQFRLPNLEPDHQGWNPGLATAGYLILGTWLTRPQFHQHYNKNNTSWFCCCHCFLLSFEQCLAYIASVW